jgi:hypothetical protein
LRVLFFEKFLQKHSKYVTIRKTKKLPMNQLSIPFDEIIDIFE